MQKCDKCNAGQKPNKARDKCIGENDKDDVNYEKHVQANQKVRKYVDEAKKAAEYTVAFRKQSLNDFLYNKADFNKRFGVSPVWKDVPSGMSQVGSWKEMDEGKTIEKLQKDPPDGLGLSEEDAKALLTSHRRLQVVQGNQTAGERKSLFKKASAKLSNLVSVISPRLLGCMF